ncbi:MAG TPA: uroporphyrinogen-III synthase [Acidimicrobiales bacterium]|nr:uroporphyrinogen-III synthase [Acidimicrobiales bacterium]
MGHGPLPCSTIPPLAGWRVGVTAHRRADEQAELLARRGAAVLIGSVVRTLPFGDDRPLRAATEALVGHPPDVVVATTGIGIRSWFGAAESWGLDRDLTSALAAAHRVARGPKARAALAAVGLASHFDEPSERLDDLVDRLVTDGIAGTRVALQLYGEDVTWAVDRLRGAGADVVAVPVYRWTAAADLDPAQRLLRELLGGQLDAVTFTSAAAVRSFAALADRLSLGDDLRAVLASTALAACVGPVTGEAAAAVGFERRCVPDRGRLGLLVRRLAAELHGRHRHLRFEDHEVVVQGGAVWGDDDHVLLTDLERTLFALLAERPHVVLSRATLRQRIWGHECGDSAIDSGVSRLRRVLRPVGCSVETVQRRGWTLGAVEVACPHVTPPLGALAG